MEAHLTADVQAKIGRIAREAGRQFAEVIEYDDLAYTREMLDRRCDEMESGNVQGIDGEEAYRRPDGEHPGEQIALTTPSAICSRCLASPHKPLKTGRGMLAKYGPAPSRRRNRREPPRHVPWLRARILR